MTVDDLLALAAKLPPNVRRLEFDTRDQGESPFGLSGHIVIETSPVVAPPVPYVGDVLRADAAKKAAERPSDVASLGMIPKSFEPDPT